MISRRINYNEGNDYDLGYKSVEIQYDDNKKIFETGDFIKDWYFMMKFVILNVSDEHVVFINSSSVDHFLMDGAPYDSAYLHFVDNKPILKYLDTSDPNYIFNQYEIYEDGLEHFVPQGTKPTWEEYKKICEQ